MSLAVNVARSAGGAGAAMRCGAQGAEL